MKKIGLFILGLCTIFFVGNFTQANNEYEYTNLDITANILIDGTIDIKEDFTANFFVNKHGIIRDIPLNYSVGGNNFHIEVSNINVQGKKFTTSKNNVNIEIKIGDADRTVIGKQKYPISYSTYGLIRNFSGMGYAELYWNLVGYDFDTNINKVMAELILPKNYTGFTADDFLITTDGTSKTIDGFAGTVDWSSGDRIIITYDKRLSAYHGITLAIKFPNNYFEFDHSRQSSLIGHSGTITKSQTKSVKQEGKLETIDIICYSFLLIPLLSFIITSIKIIKNIIRQWRQVSKIRKIRKGYSEKYPVIIQYNPPKGLNSAEVGLLLKHRVWAKDLLSLIYERAADGYIKIDNQNSDLFLIKIKDLQGSFQDYEIKLFNKLFVKNKINVNKTSNSFYSDIKSASKRLEYLGISLGWFSKTMDIDTDPKISIGCSDVFLFILSLPFLSIIQGCGVIYLALVILFLSVLSAKGFFLESDKGAKLISHILGYKEFLKTCDENKLRDFLQQDPLYFDKILPYAIVFGIETKLIKKMKNIMQELDIEPARYNGNISTIPSTTSRISSSLNYNPSNYSSSGGFSSGSSFDSGGSSFSSGGGGGGGGGSSR